MGIMHLDGTIQIHDKSLELIAGLYLLRFIYIAGHELGFQSG